MAPCGGADLGADAARRGVGVLGQQADGAGLGQVGAVDAGVGADEAVPGLDDEDAALGAQHLAALLEDQLDQGRLLAEHRGEAARLAAREHRGEAADASLGLGDDLLRDDDDVAVFELGARGDQLAERHRPRRPRAGPRPGWISTARSHGWSRSYAERLRGSLGAARARLQLAGEGDDVGRGVEVERQRGQLLDRERHAGLAGGGDVAGAASLAEGGPDRAGRRQRQRVGAGPVAVGDDGDVALGDAGQQAVELARVEQRAVAGEEDDAARRRALGAGDPGQRRPGVASFVGVGDRPPRPPPRRAPAPAARC